LIGAKTLLGSPRRHHPESRFVRGDRLDPGHDVTIVDNDLASDLERLEHAGLDAGDPWTIGITIAHVRPRHGPVSDKPQHVSDPDRDAPGCGLKRPDRDRGPLFVLA
jgi:hypothetical protein